MPFTIGYLSNYTKSVLRVKIHYFQKGKIKLPENVILDSRYKVANIHDSFLSYKPPLDQNFHALHILFFFLFSTITCYSKVHFTSGTDHISPLLTKSPNILQVKGPCRCIEYLQNGSHFHATFCSDPNHNL